MDKTIALSLRNITKRYPGVLALNDVSIDFYKGEVHALVGENGAGKSTFIKILAGAIEADSGTITVDGQEFEKMNPALSKKLGIEVIYQEFNSYRTLSVAENVFMGSLIGNGIVVNKGEMEKRTRALLEEMQVDIDPSVKVKDLTVAYQQLVEIIKAVSNDLKILVMDEPTAPLTNNEVTVLFKMVEKLKKKGVTILYISHRMSEIFDICDRVTVLRDGNKITSYPIEEATRERLIHDMIGREMNESFPARNGSHIGKTMLRVENLCGNGVKDLSFEVKAGEVLGIAGLVGAGRTEACRMLFGADRRESGKIWLDGKEIDPKSPGEALREGIALIPEDRKQQGVILNLSISQNISVSVIKELCRFGTIQKNAENGLIKKQINALRIKTPSAAQLVKNLSGGNQQKVVLAKWLSTKCKVFIFDEPTRGIDVGAKQEIYGIMNQLCAEGNAIIMVSSEMDEIIGMSDRIIVLSEGRMRGSLDRREVTQEKIMSLASME